MAFDPYNKGKTKGKEKEQNVKVYFPKGNDPWGKWVTEEWGIVGGSAVKMCHP